MVREIAERLARLAEIEKKIEKEVLGEAVERERKARRELGNVLEEKIGKLLALVKAYITDVEKACVVIYYDGSGFLPLAYLKTSNGWLTEHEVEKRVSEKEYVSALFDMLATSAEMLFFLWLTEEGMYSVMPVFRVEGAIELLVTGVFEENEVEEPINEFLSRIEHYAEREEAEIIGSRVVSDRDCTPCKLLVTFACKCGALVEAEAKPVKWLKRDVWSVCCPFCKRKYLATSFDLMLKPRLKEETRKRAASSRWWMISNGEE